MLRPWNRRVGLAAVLTCGLTFGLTLLPVAAQAPPEQGPTGGRPFQGQEFRAQLRGFEETPAISTQARGQFRARVTATAINFELTYSGLSGNVLFAHIHLGQRDVAGGVVAFFCGGGGKPACPEGTSGAVTGTITPENILALPNQGIAAGEFDELVRAIRSGVTYANVHSVPFPGGEIRGQLQRVERFSPTYDRDGD